MYPEVCSESEKKTDLAGISPPSKTEIVQGKRKRPVGVTILAVLNMVGAVILVLAALGAGSELNDPGAASAYGTLLGLFGALSLTVAIGLWRLRNWARITAVVMYSLSAIVGLISLGKGDPTGFMQALVAGSIVAYLCRAHARNAFHSRAVSGFGPTTRD